MNKLETLLTGFKQLNKTKSDADNIELEIRFRDFTKTSFLDLYQKLIENDDVKPVGTEYTVNMISKDVFEKRDYKGNYIYQVPFIDGLKMEAKYLRKGETKLGKINISDFINYRISTAVESVSNKFTVKANSHMRFKARVSFKFNDFPQWRIDITAVKSGESKELGPNAGRIVKSLFDSCPNAEDYGKVLNFNEANSYEVEIEYVGDVGKINIDDFAIISTLFNKINPSYKNQIQIKNELVELSRYILDRHAQKKFNFKPSLKTLANQAKTLTKSVYYTEIYPPEGYYMTDKADGFRSLISIKGQYCKIIADKYIEISIAEANEQLAVLDAELIYDGDDIYIYLFDIIAYNGESLVRLPFSERHEYLKPASELAQKFLSRHSKKSKVSTKHFIRLERDSERLEEQIMERWNAEYPYEIDGLIISEADKSYSETGNFKWKPPNRNTIDFYAVKCPEEFKDQYPTKKGHELYLLFVGISEVMRNKLGIQFLPFYQKIFPTAEGKPYLPIQFSPSINPKAYIYYHPNNLPSVDHVEIELLRSKVPNGTLSKKNNSSNSSPEELEEWRFIKVRDDRKTDGAYGNDYRTAESNYINFIDPFGIEDLWTPSAGYFQKNVDNMYKAMTGFNRFVITKMMNEHVSELDLVIDLGSGRGADIPRYQNNNVSSVLFIDRDEVAIAELVRRKFEHLQRQKYRETKDSSINIYAMVKDLSLPAEEIIEEMKKYGITTQTADGVVCNFAIHYFCTDIKTLRNFLKLVSSVLKPNGKFMFSTMDGKRIFELLGDSEQWETKADGIRKYAIQKNYSGKTLAGTGQQIAVKLPFTDDLIEEPLANIEFIISEAEKLNMKLHKQINFSEYLDEYKTADYRRRNNLTADDIQYIELFTAVVLTSVPPVGGTEVSKKIMWADL